jgi:hypothetical protein
MQDVYKEVYNREATIKREYKKHISRQWWIIWHERIDKKKYSPNPPEEQAS